MELFVDDSRDPDNGQYDSAEDSLITVKASLTIHYPGLRIAMYDDRTPTI